MGHAVTVGGTLTVNSGARSSFAGPLTIGYPGISTDAARVDWVGANYQPAGSYQANLGFTPVQQGGGSGMAGNKIYLGWTGARMAVQVDGSPQGNIWTTNQLNNPVTHDGSNNINVNRITATGYATRAGTGGGFYGHDFNFGWFGTTLEAWIDSSFVGAVFLSSDYRIKKDVIDLPGMWDTVKALRPIKYTHQDFQPPSQVAHIEQKKAEEAEIALKEEREVVPIDDSPMFKGSDVEQWGFIAHELQETLTQSAATGEKDSHDTVQSPNPWTVISALTKALQEAMTRIEALEAQR